MPPAAPPVSTPPSNTDNAGGSVRGKAAAPLHARIAELERRAEANPEAYRGEVKRFVRLGIAAYLLMLGVAVAVFVAPIWLLVATGRSSIFLAIPGAIVTYALLAALLARAEEPPFMIGVGPEEAPELWEEVESLRRHLNAPPIDGIGLDLEMDAGVMRYARFRLWGKGRSVLRFGLPFVLACDAEELRAAIARALGHHRAGHEGEHLRSVRFADALTLAAERLQTSNVFAEAAVGPFARWYLPRLGEMLVPIHRRRSREADAALVEMGLARVERDRRIRSELFSRWYLRAFLPFRPTLLALRTRLESPISVDELRETLLRSLQGHEDPTDVRPTLADDLASLGFPLTREHVDEFAAAAAGTSAPRAFETYFTPEFRENASGWLGDIMALIGGSPGDLIHLEDDEVAPAVGLPPTPLEAAAALTSSAGFAVGQTALFAVARDETQPVADRFDAAIALHRADPYAPEAREAFRTLLTDPYMGADARDVLAVIEEDLFQSGRSMDRAAVDAAKKAVEGDLMLRRNFVGAIRKDRSGLQPMHQPVPRDVEAALAKRLANVPEVRSAWLFWARHSLMPTVSLPLLVMDLGLEIGGLKIHVEDPRLTATQVEIAMAAPCGTAPLVLHGKKEREAIVGARTPFYTGFAPR